MSLFDEELNDRIISLFGECGKRGIRVMYVLYRGDNLSLKVTKGIVEYRNMSEVLLSL